MDYYSKYYDLITECEDILDEGYKKKGRRRVIRKGKMTRKLFCGPGQKSAKGGKRCVPMKSKERVSRKRQAVKSAIKRKGKMSRIKRKRAKAARKRRAMGL
jgi:hypothetical protein